MALTEFPNLRTLPIYKSTVLESNDVHVHVRACMIQVFSQQYDNMFLMSYY